MRKMISLLVVVSVSVLAAQGQKLKDLIKIKSSDSAKVVNAVNSIFKTKSGDSTLSTTDVVAGLKQALEKGAQNGSSKLSAVDGFFANAAVKILMPPEAKKVESTLRSLGMGKLVDDAILSMNRAAEDAAKSAAPIFVNAIKSMSIADAWGILRGGDTAATVFLKSKTTLPLTDAFRPVVEKSIGKVNATKYWTTVFTTYNKFSRQKVNTDLSAYITEKALQGVFLQIAEEEKSIRKNPLARTTELLKKVFGN